MSAVEARGVFSLVLHRATIPCSIVMNATARHRQPAVTTRPGHAWPARWTDNDHESEETMATAEECRAALEQLTDRIADMDAQARAKHLVDRTLSLRVPDLDVTFLTRLGPHGADPVLQVSNGAQAQVRFTANSDDVVAIASDPASFMRAWLTGRLKVQGSVFDLLELRRLM
jgi:hypothetical protein